MKAYFILNKKVKEICEIISKLDDIKFDFIENLLVEV
jgi:hypothetical protein